MSHEVAGIFSDEAAANKAVTQLVEAHFDPSAVRIIAAHHKEREEVPVVDWVSAPVTLVIGLGTGVVVGAALLGAAGAGWFPGYIPQNSAAWGAFQGAYIGGAMGALAGGLFGLGIHRFSANFKAVHVHEGAIWVGVTAAGEAIPRAREAMQRAGARHFVERDT